MIALYWAFLVRANLLLFIGPTVATSATIIAPIHKASYKGFVSPWTPRKQYQSQALGLTTAYSLPIMAMCVWIPYQLQNRCGEDP